MFLVLCVFSMTNICILSSPHFFFFLTLRNNNKTVLAPKFKNWDLIQTIVLYEECETFDSFLMKFPEERAMVP